MKKDAAAPDKTGHFEEDRNAQWKAVSGLLRAEIGEAAYQSWLKPMTVRGVHDGLVRISVPTRFMRDWIVAHYVDRLSELWSKEDPDIKGVEVYIQSDREIAPSAPPSKASGAATSAAGGETPSRPQTDISAPLDRRFTFERPPHRTRPALPKKTETINGRP